MDALASTLGVEFKASKDEGLDHPIRSVEFLGHWLTTDGVVQAQPAPAKLAKLSAQLATAL